MEHEKKLADWAQRELSRLPDRPAPAGLIPAVLARIQAQSQLPWYHKAWNDWPVGAQAAALALMLASAGLVIFASMQWSGPDLWQAVRGVAEPFLARLEPLGETTSLLNQAFSVLAGKLSQQWLLLGLAIAGLMYAACLAIGTVCFRLAWSRRFAS
jgi:disulfide bond formation protein DsbB